MRHWNQLLVHEVQQLHDAEMRWLGALPKLKEKARDPALKAAFEKHLDETAMQVGRLEQVAQMLSVPPDEVSCKGMKGLVKEAGNVLRSKGDPEVVDAALIGAAQKVELYEVAAYGTARLHALNLGLDIIAQLLGESLEEQAAAHRRLTAIAEGRHLLDYRYLVDPQTAMAG